MKCMKDGLTVRIVTVNHQIPDIQCDGVRVPISDSAKGDFSGYYGIKKGHAKAVFSLRAGKITLTKNENTIFTAEISDGFALIENNEVNVIVDKIEK